MLESAILKTFCSNYVSYYKAHSSHWNTTGRNFYSDHKLLNKIYEDLQDEIDTLAEIIRTLDILAPATLTEIVAVSNISDAPIFDDGDGDDGDAHAPRPSCARRRGRLWPCGDQRRGSSLQRN